MSEPSMVCNGHKENNLEKNQVNTPVFPFEKSLPESTNATDSSARGSMTIGTLPFRDFDHLYASSVEETGEQISVNMNVARTNLNSYHLNLIEEQAKTIEAQSQEIMKLKKQNESLIARIERMNRRLNLNQCSRRGVPHETKILRRQTSQDESALRRTNISRDRNDSFGDSFSDDVPLSNLTPNDPTRSGITRGQSALSNSFNIIKDEPMEDPNSQCDSGHKSNFNMKFRRTNLTYDEHQPKRAKVVRFVEEKRDHNGPADKIKRNCAKTAVDEKLISGDEVLFRKTVADHQFDKMLNESNVNDSEQNELADIAAKKKKSIRIPVLTSSDPYYMAPKSSICSMNDPVTYTPTALEIPSFKVIDRDYVESENVPKDFFEDVTIEAAKERHLRFEVGERKRKKWDVQRIRELRQNERLKEKLNRRKSSRWNKMESPQKSNADLHEITSLFPNVKCIEKIILTDDVPVTAFGTCIPRVPSWGSNFKTEWSNDGTCDPSTFEDNKHVGHQLHHKDGRNKLA